MNKDTYGVELDLIIGRFQNKMKEVTNKLSDLEDIEIEPKIDTDKLLKGIEDAKEELKRYKDIEILNPQQLKRVENLNQYISDATDSLKEFSSNTSAIERFVGNVAENKFEKGLGTNILYGMKERMEEMSGVDLSEEEFLQILKEANEEADKLDKQRSNNLSGMFTKATKSLKRFALSLFGIQSVWAVLSRATHTYMNENKQLQNTIKSIWSGLGTLVAPLVDWLANVFLKLLGYINVVTVALFKFDFIAKANAKTLENYGKKAKKTTQALAGIDELTNINQQTGSDDDEGPALIKTPELNEGIVKKLQDMSKWLKDNWDWLGKVLLALGAVFGTAAVANWLSGIGALIGEAGVGLIGLAAALLLVYDAVKYKELYDEWKKLKKFQKELEKSLNKLHDDYMQTVNDKEKEAEAYEAGSQEVSNYTAQLEANTRMSKSDIESGRLSVAQLKNQMEEVIKNTEAYKKLYDQNKLNIEQTKNYADYMAQLGLKVDGTKMKVTDYMKYQAILNSGTKDAAEKAREFAAQLNNIDGSSDKAKNKVGIFTTAVENVKTQVENATNKTKTFADKLDEISRKKYGVDFQTKFGINIDDLRKMLNNMKNTGLAKMFNLDKVIDNFMRTIPGLSIGTDLVKQEGLAYLHAGEKVVPANVVGGGYSGNDDTNNLLRQLIEVVDNKDFTATISENEVGSASVNYIRKQNRMMGGSII